MPPKFSISIAAVTRPGRIEVEYSARWRASWAGVERRGRHDFDTLFVDVANPQQAEDEIQRKFIDVIEEVLNPEINQALANIPSGKHGAPVGQEGIESSGIEPSIDDIEIVVVGFRDVFTGPERPGFI